jgi:hypothetical protein
MGLGVHSTATSSKPNAYQLEVNGVSFLTVFPAEKAMIPSEQAVIQ